MTLSCDRGLTLGRDHLLLIQPAEHHMGMSAVDGRRWTAPEVRALIDANPLQSPRYELVDGELLVTPSPALPHQRMVGLLFIALSQYLDGTNVGIAVTSPSDVELSPGMLVQPDVFVIPIREWTRGLAEGNPVRELMLAIEVLSPSSSRHDRVKKRPRYQQTVPEYWIVDLDARLVERWRPSDTRPEIIEGTLVWHPPDAGVALSVFLGPLFQQALGS